MERSRWNVWCVREGVREPLERVLEEGAEARMQDGGAYVWTPLADVTETAAAIVIVVELPGVAAGQVVVEIAEGELVVRGERPSAREDPQTAYHVVERPHGAFARRFPMPPGAVDAAAAGATLRDGLLTVTVPKRARKMPARYSLALD